MVAGEKRSVVPERKVFLIRRKVWSEMIRHCKAELPYEGCGLLSGEPGHGLHCWTMKNINASPTSFTMDDNQVKKTFRQMETNGERLTGIFHSHPASRAYPSSQDIRHAHYPEAVYIIISFRGNKPKVKGYKIHKGKVTPVRLQKY